MKLFISILFCFALVANAAAQSLADITNFRDTSYNNQSAYRSTVKSHPQIKLVEELRSPLLAEKRNIVYNKVGKRKLLLDAFYPTTKSNQKQKAVIIIHGGGWRSGDKSQHYPLAQHLAQLGYVCFTPEYRLSTEALYPAAVHDMKASVRWVRKHAKKYNIDPDQITVMGFSAGGELAAFLGATNGMKDFEGNGYNKKISSTVNALVDIDGTLSFVHPESGEGDDSKRTSAGTYWFGYSKKDNPALWQQASPLTHVGKQSPPTLFINSSVDRMHAGRNDYIKILNDNGIFSSTKTFEKSPHGFCLFEPWFTPTVQYIDEFLKTVFVNS